VPGADDGAHRVAATGTALRVSEGRAELDIRAFQRRYGAFSWRRHGKRWRAPPSRRPPLHATSPSGQAWLSSGIDTTMSVGMFFSVICAEDAPFFDDAGCCASRAAPRPRSRLAGVSHGPRDDRLRRSGGHGDGPFVLVAAPLSHGGARLVREPLALDPPIDEPILVREPAEGAVSQRLTSGALVVTLGGLNRAGGRTDC
jgi:hypothetical protein